MIEQPAETPNTLLMAVVQAQDADIVENILNTMNISLIRLPSTGAFLGRRNATLLIGIPLEQQQQILEALQENCRQRIEYIAVPLESAPLPLPAPTPVTVGGATVFGLEVEHYEEL
ncbi:MAG TPA: cyclic-di-AMP receptor [Anaerolineaceae bacterium]|nr:cyclic-di-AMP receptor [Anaerolineaceae bacterium]